MTKRIILLVSFALCLNTLFAQGEVFIKPDGAIQGYDPVAYFKESKPVKGKKEFQHEWKGATWYFSSAQNLKDFKAAPEKYAPQYGGYCAWGMSRGYKAPTSADAWTIVDGKLYLNYDTDVRKKWDGDQKGHIKKADANWPTVKMTKE